MTSEGGAAYSSTTHRQPISHYSAVTSNSGGPAVASAAGAMLAGAGVGNAAAASPQPLIVPQSGAYVVPPTTVTAPLPSEAQTAVAALPGTPASAILVASAGASSVHFDPMRGSGPSSDYDRAQSACLEGRGYAVQ